jgi:hypothetical protein
VKEVAVRTLDRRLEYSQIYAFGHRDANTVSKYLQLSSHTTTGFQTILELSAFHFAPVLTQGEFAIIFYTKSVCSHGNDIGCSIFSMLRNSELQHFAERTFSH